MHPLCGGAHRPPGAGDRRHRVQRHRLRHQALPPRRGRGGRRAAAGDPLLQQGQPGRADRPFHRHCQGGLAALHPVQRSQPHRLQPAAGHTGRTGQTAQRQRREGGQRQSGPGCRHCGAVRRRTEHLFRRGRPDPAGAGAGGQGRDQRAVQRGAPVHPRPVRRLVCRRPADLPPYAAGCAGAGPRAVCRCEPHPGQVGDEPPGLGRRAAAPADVRTRRGGAAPAGDRAEKLRPFERLPPSPFSQQGPPCSALAGRVGPVVHSA